MTARTHSLCLEAEVNIRGVAALRAECLDALSGNGDVTVDCSAVERIDTASLQCLCALALDLQGNGRQLVIAEPSARFDQVVSILGLDEVLR